MTENTNTFAARLRELIQASSLAPWEASGEVIYDPVAGIGEMYDAANADLVVHLRNHADRLADLVERVEAYRALVGDAVLPTTTTDKGIAIYSAKSAMLAALDALDRPAP